MIRNTASILCLILIVCLIAGIIAAVRMLGMPEGYRLLTMIREILNAHTLSGNATISMPDGRILSADYYTETWMDKHFLCLNAEGQSFYYQGGRVFLDNGRGYDFSWIVDALPIPDQNILWGLLLAGVRTEHQSGETVYSFTLPESLLEQTDTRLGDCIFFVTERDHQIVRLQACCDSGWELDISVAYTAPESIPTHIRMASGGTTEDGKTLLPLLRGGQALASREAVELEARMEVRCGSLPIRDSGRLICDCTGITLIRDGKEIAIPLSEGAGSDAWMVGMGFLLCRDGKILCTDDESGSYTLNLPGEELESVMFQLFPELEGLGITLSEGALVLTVAGNVITDLSVNCPAQLPLLGTTVPLTVSIVLHQPT